MAKTSDAMRKAIDKYQKEKVDEIKLRVPKGKKTQLQDYAKSKGESLNGFVNRAIDEAIERDNSAGAGTVTTSEKQLYNKVTEMKEEFGHLDDVSNDDNEAMPESFRVMQEMLKSDKYNPLD